MMRLLLAHSDESARRSLASTLDTTGAVVVEAASGAEALRVIRWCGMLDAAIVHGVLSDGSGEGLVSQLRQSQPGLPVVALGFDVGGEATNARTIDERPVPDALFHALEELGVLRVAAETEPRREHVERALPFCPPPAEVEGLVIVASPDGRVSYVNRAARQVLGIEDTEGLTLDSLSRDWVAPFPGGEPRWDVMIPLPDGRQIEACQTYAEITDPEGNRSTVVTLRPLATHCPRLGEVLASEHRFRVLLEELHVGIVVQDKDDRILVSNQRACDLLGLTRDQLHGKSSFDPEWHVIRESGERFKPEEHPSVVAMKTKEPVREVVMGVYRPRQRDRVWILVSAEPVKNQSGDVDRVIVTLSDVGQYKALKDRLSLTHRLQGIGTLAAGVGHDFNNMLATIMTSAEGLLLGPIDEDSRELAETILMTAKRGAALTRKLRTIAREEASKPERVVVDALLADLSPLLRRTLPGDIEFDVELGAEGCAVWIDPTELERVVLNLVVNARDAQPKGGRIRITTRAISAEPESPRSVELCVADDGPGIAPEVQPHIFEPMFSTKGPGEGTGLGLATARGAISVASGTIDFDTSDRGTTFRIRLPEAAVEPAAEPTTEPPLHETILVAEDDELILDIVHRNLRDAGYTVLLARDGMEAWDHLQADRGDIALVLTDAVMPGLSGLSLRERARGLRNVPFLFMSGYNLPTRASDSGTEAEVRVLKKPFSRATLLKAVSETLHG